MDEILDAQRSEQIAKDQHEKAIVKARLQLGMHVNLPDSYVGSKDEFGIWFMKFLFKMSKLMCEYLFYMFMKVMELNTK